MYLFSWDVLSAAEDAGQRVGTTPGAVLSTAEDASQGVATTPAWATTTSAQKARKWVTTAPWTTREHTRRSTTTAAVVCNTSEGTQQVVYTLGPKRLPPSLGGNKTPWGVPPSLVPSPVPELVPAGPNFFSATHATIWCGWCQVLSNPLI